MKYILILLTSIYMMASPVDYALSYVQKFGKIPKGFEDNKQVVINAVKKSGYNLKYASSRLKKDEDISLLAIRNNYYAIKFTKLRSSLDFAFKALSTNSKVAKFINRKLLDIPLFHKVLNSNLKQSTKDNFLKYFVRFKVNFAKNKFFTKLNSKDIAYILSSKELFEYTFNKLTKRIKKLNKNPFKHNMNRFINNSKFDTLTTLKIMYTFAYYRKKSVYSFGDRDKEEFVNTLVSQIEKSAINSGYIAYILDFIIRDGYDVELIVNSLHESGGKYSQIIASLLYETSSKIVNNKHLRNMHNKFKVDFKYRAKVDKLFVKVKNIKKENIKLDGITKELNEVVIVYEDGDYDGLSTYNYLKNKKLTNGWSRKYIGSDKAILLLYKKDKKTKRIFKKYINNPKYKDSLVKVYKYFKKHKIKPNVYSLRAHSNYNYLLKYFLPKYDRYMILNYGSCATRRDFKKIYSKYPSAFLISNKQKGYKVINESLSFILDKALLKNKEYIYFDKIMDKTKRQKYKLKKGETKRIEQHAYFKYYIMPSKFIDDLIPVIKRAYKRK